MEFENHTGSDAEHKPSSGLPAAEFMGAAQWADLCLKNRSLPLAAEHAGTRWLQVMGKAMNSPLAAGIAPRLDLNDACASLWQAGNLVIAEHLALYDMGANRRMSDLAMYKAHKALQMRRWLARQSKSWKPTPENIFAGSSDDEIKTDKKEQGLSKSYIDDLLDFTDGLKTDDNLDGDYQLLSKILDKKAPKGAVDPASSQLLSNFYDSADIEAARVKALFEMYELVRQVPSVAAAAILGSYGQYINVFARQPWAIHSLSAHYIKAGFGLDIMPSIATGFHSLRRDRKKYSATPAGQALDWCDAITEGAEQALAIWQRLTLARALNQSRPGTKASKAGPLFDLFLEHPYLSSEVIMRRLSLTRAGAIGLVKRLPAAPREVTEQGSWRIWAIS